MNFIANLSILFQVDILMSQRDMNRLIVLPANILLYKNLASHFAFNWGIFFKYFSHFWVDICSDSFFPFFFILFVMRYSWKIEHFSPIVDSSQISNVIDPFEDIIVLIIFIGINNLSQFLGKWSNFKGLIRQIAITIILFLFFIVNFSQRTTSSFTHINIWDNIILIYARHLLSYYLFDVEPW